MGCKVTGTTSLALNKTTEVLDKQVEREVDVSADASNRFKPRLRFATYACKYDIFSESIGEHLRIYGGQYALGAQPRMPCHKDRN